MGTATIPAVIRRASRLAWHLARAALTILGLSSYFAYTTAGLDFESPSPDGADVTYYRLRWDDGSTWAGVAVQPMGRPEHPLEWFDPGGTLLAAPTRPARRTGWNRLGFWSIGGAAADPYVAPRYRGATFSRWAAVPSWLVIAGLWYRPLRPLAARLRGRLMTPTRPVQGDKPGL